MIRGRSLIQAEIRDVCRELKELCDEAAHHALELGKDCERLGEWMFREDPMKLLQGFLTRHMKMTAQTRGLSLREEELNAKFKRLLHEYMTSEEE